MHTKSAPPPGYKTLVQMTNKYWVGALLKEPPKIREEESYWAHNLPP